MFKYRRTKKIYDRDDFTFCYDLPSRPIWNVLIYERSRAPLCSGGSPRARYALALKKAPWVSGRDGWWRRRMKLLLYYR